MVSNSNIMAERDIWNTMQTCQRIVVYLQGRRINFRAGGGGVGAARNERAIKTIGEGNEMKNWVPWVLPWKFL